MTKEELLAEEYICNGKCQDDITKNYVHCKTCTRLKDFLAGYSVGKADLEKENVELKEKLEGAEFGYDKANEWHYPLRLDENGEPVLDNPIAESYPIEILMYDFETGTKEVIKYDTAWAYYRKDGSSIRINSIVWQYISIPSKKEQKNGK